MKYIYLLKFIIYGSIGAYDYYNCNRLAAMWFLLSTASLAFYLLIEIEEMINNSKN